MQGWVKGKLRGKTILITGGTGSLGQELVRQLLKKRVKKVIVYSRNEFNQWRMRQSIQDKRVRFFIGDVRDKERLKRAFAGVNYAIHAAALKHIDVCNYNPYETIQTNINGSQNVIEAAMDCGLEKVLAIGTDKAVNPINLYGASKLCADKLFTSAGAYASGCKFAVMRCGNFLESSGSVIPLWKEQAKTGVLTVTDERMTRFVIRIADAAKRAIEALWKMRGGEIFCPKMQSIRLKELAHSIAPKAKWNKIGLREDEKLHEDMITVSDASKTVEQKRFYVIGGKGKPVGKRFSYRSDNNQFVRL